MNIDPYYQRQKCSPMTLVSVNIRRMRIFVGFPWAAASSDSAVVDCNGGQAVVGVKAAVRG